MLDAPPTESEKTSWLYVAIGIMVIYATIPAARTLRNAVDAQVGRDLFLYLTATLILLTGVAALRNLRRRKLPIRAYIWLFAIIGMFGVFIYQLRKIPEEAIHIVEYAGLGLLVFRALSHRLNDHGIYLAAALVVGIVGMLDEYIQWVVPDRYFDLRDILINFISGAIAQIAIMNGLRPSRISGSPGAKSGSYLCFIGAVGTILLAVGFQNTPQRIVRLAEQYPAMEFLVNSGNPMVEYGYRYSDPETGVFRSRFTLEALDRLDQQRGPEVARILDRYIRAEGYRAFLGAHSVYGDPYAHEAGVHLFRREYYIDRAREGSDRSAEHYSISLHENRILTKYFGRAIGQSTHRWNPATEAEVSSQADRSLEYESAVSANLVTRFSPRQTLILFALATIALLGFGLRLGKISRKGSPA